MEEKMYIRKDNGKKECIVVALVFPEKQEQRFENGKKSMNFRIELTDIKSIRDFTTKVEKFLREYVSHN